MRHDEHAWDPKGSAQLIEICGGTDAQGKIVAWETQIRGTGGRQWVTS
jgi:nicotinate dehydrogenase subunit B